MRRLNKGAPIRTAMSEAGLDIPRLVEATRKVDPTGAGLSRAYIGFITGAGASAREECSDRAGELLSQALDKPVEDLFATEPPCSAVVESTSTPRVQIMTSDPTAPPAPLLTSKELCAWLRKSPSWLEREIKTDPTFPVHYAGRSRRFVHTEVLDHQAKKRAARLAKSA